MKGGSRPPRRGSTLRGRSPGQRRGFNLHGAPEGADLGPRTSPPLALAALLALACGSRAPDPRLARLEAERRALEAQLDALEERLLADQARVRFWRELRERHEGVTAIACASQEGHAEQMARHLLATDPRHAQAAASGGQLASFASAPAAAAGD